MPCVPGVYEEVLLVPTPEEKRRWQDWAEGESGPWCFPVIIEANPKGHSGAGLALAGVGESGLYSRTLISHWVQPSLESNMALG